MKHVFTLFTSLLLLLVSGAHAQQWTWLTGGNTPNVLPNYVDDPGGRQGSAMWSGSDGKVYVFGGNNFEEGFFYADLWAYDTLAQQWTFVSGSQEPNAYGIYGTQGISDAMNRPGARQQAASWADNNGNLWLFGGLGYGASTGYGELNDLWMYSIQTGVWTWVSGSSETNSYGIYGELGVPASSNSPGSRHVSAFWLLNNDLYLFGGNGFGSISMGYLNDLWKYSIQDNQWVYLSGSMTADTAGNYGIQNVPSATNQPGPRAAACQWASENNSILYLFGGSSAVTTEQMNDLWQYDVNTGIWTWISGTSVGNHPGVSGELGVPSTGNVPAGRLGAVSFAQNNYLWLFGGYTNYYINDLWRYTITTGEWTWMGGDVFPGDQGLYFEQGPSTFPNYPSNKEAAQGCVSDNGKFWLFGGTGSVGGVMNDLWKLEVAPDAPALTCNPLPANLQQGLVGYWPFCGNTNDESGNGNDGVVMNAQLSHDRFNQPNRSYHFDNFNDFIQVTNNESLSLDSNFCISLWFNSEATTSFNCFLSKSSCLNGDIPGYVCGLWDFDTSGENPKVNLHAYPYLNNAQASLPQAAETIELDIWYHFVVKYDKVNHTLFYYLNGDLLDSLEIFFEIEQTDLNLIIGNHLDAFNGLCTSTFMIGRLDDIGIWNRLLTDEEITQLYGGFTQPISGCTDLLACNYNSGATEDDGSCLFVGGPCDDLNALTENDVIDSSCGCSGTPIVVNCAALDPALQNGLVGYWPFCGNANDESGNGLDGVLMEFNGVSFQENPNIASSLGTDRFGNNLSALATTTYASNVEIPVSSELFENEFTISLWAKNDSAVSLYPTIVESENFNFVIQYGNTGGPVSIGSYMNGPSVTPFGSVYSEIDFQDWSLITVVNENFQNKFYINGVLVDTSSDLTTLQGNAPGSFIRIGNGLQLPQEAFYGLIDDVTIHNRALTPAEITSLYTGEPVVQPACATLDPALQNGLVGYWPFCGNANDESGNGNDGVVNGATLTEDRFGNAGGAFAFDGVDDFIDVTTNSSLDVFGSEEESTISLWINKENVNTAGDFLSRGWHSESAILGNRYVAFGHDNSIQSVFMLNNQQTLNSVRSNTEYLTPNTWVNLTVVRKAEMTFYVNGVEVSTQVINDGWSTDYNSTLAPITNLIFGARNNLDLSSTSFKNFFWDGSIDDIGIWNRALTPAEITSLYTGEPVAQPACATLDPTLQNGLVGYWPFCGNANDESGNGNDGVVNGAMLTEDRLGNAESAYAFDGVSNYISANIDSQLSMTVSLWYNSSNPINWYPRLLGVDDVEFLAMNGNNPAFIQSNLYGGIGGYPDPINSFPFIPNFNVWHHVVIIHDHNLGIRQLYIDNELRSNTETTEFLNIPLGNLTIGNTLSGTSGDAGAGYVGSIDDIGIWNRALTAEEIALLYGNFTQPIPGCTEPLAFNYNPQANQNEGCLYTASVFVYNDLNGNGAHEEGEPGLANWPVVGNDINGLLWTNGNGNAFVAVPTGSYEFTVLNTTDNWVLTTEASGTLSVGNMCMDQNGMFFPCPNTTLSFGLQVIPGEAIVAAGPFNAFWDILHCTDGFESGVYLENIGAQTVSGFMTLTCDPLFTPDGSSYFTTPPVETGPGYALWNIEDFLPGEYELLSYFVPGPGVEYLNAVFNFSLELTLLDPQGNIIYDETWDASPIVACAYDPNDLTGYPEGLDSPHDEGYTIEHFMRPDNMVEFRVRFQNTGTLPAEDIDIYIPIDASVWDLSTIEPLARAADMQVLCLHDDGSDLGFSLYDSLEHELPEGVSATDLLIFSFEDIFLPDSASDPEGSQGYVFFQMQAKHGLDVNTELNAQAFIYFEQNPPITTNETYHVIFDCASFTPMVGDPEICDGESLIFDATQPYVDTYEWQLNNVVIGSANTLQYPAEVGMYTLELNTKNVLCPQGENHDVTVIVHEMPELDLPLDETECEGDPIILEAEYDGMITWSNGLSTGDTLIADTSFTVTITVIGEGGCSISEDWSVTVNPLPSAAVDSANFVLTAADGVAWQWLINGVEGVTTQSITATENGNYQVEITSEFGCDVMSDVYVVQLPPDTTTTVFVHSWPTLHLYPNPMITAARLELPQGTCDIALYDITGACVRTLSNQQGTVVITRDALAAGVYQLQVRQGEVVKSVRLVVE